MPWALGSELEVDAEGVGAWSRIRGPIDPADSQPAHSVEYFGVIALVLRGQQQVVARDVDARRLPAHQPRRQIEGVAEGDVLQPYEGAILDPARRVLRRLGDAVRIRERRSEEVASLLGIALRLEDEGSVVEHLAAELTAPQPARVELAPRQVVVEAEGEVRIGAADELPVRIRWIGGRAVHAAGARVGRRGAGEELLATLHIQEAGCVEAA